MTRPLRDEARDPATTPGRLLELIHLPGDHGDIDSDSGWCREYVAANPSASPETLAELANADHDYMVRKFVAANPSTLAETVEHLSRDKNDFVANAALENLGLPLRRIQIQYASKIIANISARGIHRW